MRIASMAVALITAGVLVLGGCKSAQDNYKDVSNGTGSDLTAGKVEREIKKGMSGADVAEALGSPNIVTKDSDEKETWVYDKIATEAAYSQSQNGLFLILGGFSNQTGARSTSQRTLTVVIKFMNSKVESFTYHQSKF